MELFTRAQRQSFQLIYVVTRGIHFANPCLLRLFYIGGRVLQGLRSGQCGMAALEATSAEDSLQSPALARHVLLSLLVSPLAVVGRAIGRKKLPKVLTMPADALCRTDGEPDIGRRTIIGGQSALSIPMERHPNYRRSDVRPPTWAGYRRPEDALPVRDTGYNPVMETAQRRLIDVGRPVAGQISKAAEVSADVPEGATRSTALRPKKTIGPTHRLPA